MPSSAATSPPLVLGRWRRFRLTRGTAYGALLDDTLARPWAWPPHAAPVLYTLSRIRPPTSPTPIAVATLPAAATGAVLAALSVLALSRLFTPAVTPTAATIAVLAALAIAAVVLVRRLRRWQRIHHHVAAPPPGAPNPFRRETVLVSALNLTTRPLALLPPTRPVLDDALRRACVRAGIPEPEITHVLRATTARHAQLPTTPATPIPGQGEPAALREPTAG